jgi:hypothetical protein
VQGVWPDTDRSIDAHPGSDRPDAPSTAHDQRHGQRPVSSASGVQLFCVDFFQHAIFQQGFGQHLLELGIFFFKLFKPFGIGHVQVAVFAFPAVEGRYGNIMLTTNRVDRFIGFGLP